MKCPECGFQLQGTETICPGCFTPLKKPESQAAPPVEPKPAPAPEAKPVGEGAPRARPGVLRSDLLSNRLFLIVTISLVVLNILVCAGLFLVLNRKNADYYLQQAQDYYQNGQYESALVAYLRVLEQNGEAATAENGIGWCYLKLDRPSLAIPHLREAVQIRPDMRSANLGLGMAYSEVGMYQEAEASLQTLWQNQDPEAGRYLGYVYYQELRYDNAIETLQTVTSKQQDPMALEYLGRALYAQGQYDEALGPLEQAIELDPDAESAREYLGRVWYQLGRCDRAMEQFQILQTAHPLDPTWHAYMGQCAYQEGQYDRAITHLNHALILGHADLILTDVPRELGWAYYQLGRYEEATVLFQRALIMAPDDAEAMAGLGTCYVRLERCQDAVPLFEQALTIDPYQEFAQQGLGECTDE